MRAASVNVWRAAPPCVTVPRLRLPPLLATLSAGYSPFYPYTQCLSEPVSFAAYAWEGISEEAKSLCRAMLTLDPTKRITAASARAHPWFSVLN